MKLGELRRLTAHLPDGTDLVCHLGDATYWEITGARPFTPVLEHDWCLVLDTGQEVTADLDLHHRDGL
jgi:hypothetical protein